MDIRQILYRINEYSALIEKGNISDIEKDILLGDLRDLYLLVKGQVPAEKVIAQPVMEAKQPVIEKAAKPVIEIAEPPVVEKVIVPEPVISPVVEEVKEINKEIPVPAMEEKEEPIQMVSKTLHYHEEAPAREAKKGSLNEVFVGEHKSLNTHLGGEKRSALNDRIASKDLKSLIDLNKQHVLTAELFKGDSAAFQSAIKHINSSTTIEAAFEYIKTELMPKYKWNGELQSTKLFDKLVRQKFGV